MGRNIWQSENPVPMIRAVRSIVHGNANVDEADELYKKFCQPKPKLPKAEKQHAKNQLKILSRW